MVMQAVATPLRRVRAAGHRLIKRSHARWAGFMARRPHRSFQLTRRRDYVRSLTLPGYWRLTSEVAQVLWRNRLMFALLLVWYAVMTALLVGIASQDTYNQLASSLNSSGKDTAAGNFGPLGKAGLLYATALTGSLNSQLDAGQQAYASLLGLLMWLVVVWLLRNVLAGQRPRLRDGLYNAGAPLVATFVLLVVLAIQALPIALAAVGYSAAVTTGLLNGGVEAMLFWTVAALLCLLSLYWMTSTFISLVVVTLPGMYPLRALRTAGDLVVGRRMRILLRLLWMLLLVVAAWAIVLIPGELFDSWLLSIVPGLSWLPLVPWLILLLSGASLIFSAGYIYVFYRKIVDDAAASTN